MSNHATAHDHFCYACGQRNPLGLGLTFASRPDGTYGTTFTPRREHQGYKGVVHGGFLALVLDETIRAELTDAGHRAATVDLTVRLLKPAAPDEALLFTARHETNAGSAVRAEAEARRAADGVLVARARAVLRTLREGEPFHAAGHAGHPPTETTT